MISVFALRATRALVRRRSSCSHYAHFHRSFMISQAVFKMVLPMACAWVEEQKAVILRVGLHSRHRGSPMRACRDHTLTPARPGCVACHRHEARSTMTV